jgi:pyruvate carboxylase subunit B
MLFTAEATRPSVNVLLHQIPGGMLSNLVSQLREQNALDKFSEVLEEIQRVRADLGYPPLVTPMSQVVGIQAVLNVLSGGRYKQVTQEVKTYLLGYYGRPPGEVNEDVRKLVIGDEEPIEVRPAELMEQELEKLRDDAHKLGIMQQEEDVVTYALYPQVAVKFLRGELKEEVIPTAVEAMAPSSSSPDLPVEFSVDVDGEVFNVKISSVLSKTVEVEKPKRLGELPKGAVVSPMAGMVLAIKVKVGSRVSEGYTVATIEAMKMENEVFSPHGGVVREIFVYEGEVVNSGDVLMVVESNGK